MLGSINGTNGATANTSVGIGTTAPTARLHVANTTATTTANAGYFVSIIQPPLPVMGLRYMPKIPMQVPPIGAVVGTSLNTTAGWGYGGYFRANYIGVFGLVSSPATGFSTYGIYGSNTALQEAPIMGVYGTAINGSVNYGVVCNAMAAIPVPDKCFGQNV
ncbi:MAG: hypothetical protein IPL84_03570 [Chitinophagaceae bacterium]|nr:hypothetical protein [Chitinophagaceae bacterium]